MSKRKVEVVAEFDDDFKSKDEDPFNLDSLLDEDFELEKLNYCGLFRYAKPLEVLMFAFGILCSAGLGALFPISMAIFADMVDRLIRNFFRAADLIEEQVPFFVYLAISSLVLGFVQMYFLTLSSKRQARRIRLLFFDSLIRQDAGWMDSKASGSLISLLSSSVPEIQSGIGNRVGSFVRDAVLFLGCIIMAYAKGWKLALVASASLPVIGASFAFLAFALKYFNTKEIQAYSEAGGIAGEVLSSIRTVFAYGGQKRTYERYANELYKAERTGIRKGMAIGAGNGFVSLSIFSAAALCLWYGITLVRTERFSNGTVILVVVSIIISSIAVGKALPEIEALARAVSAAKKVYAIIDRVPPIDIEKGGEIIPDFQGRIEFKNVNFSYPSRPNVPILKNFNLTIEPGKKVAIVGFSGSGKSTAIHLIQRLYDPQDGEILVDGESIQNLDVGWLRRQIGTVSQEATLFTGTIAENIRMGDLHATMDEVIQAAQLAEASEFIYRMPEGFNTWLNEGGAKLSGGQRQRIAIARALVRRPKILLLDEATSALDTRTEKSVQRALEQAGAGRTVLMVAHRLTTVREADVIVVMKDGIILEQGTHEQLRDMKGQYYRMLQAQGLLKEESTKNKEVAKSTDLEKMGVKIYEKHDEFDNEMEKLDEIIEEGESEPKKESQLAAFRKKWPMWQALRLNKPECLYLIMGLLMAIAVGIIEPLFALVYSDMFDLALMIFTPMKMQRKANRLAVNMIFLGFMRMIATFVQRTMLGIAGERLTRRVREMLFKSILKQEVAWFDKSENQPGVLTARLAADAPSLEKISGTQLGVMVEATCLVIVSLVIACSYSWKVTLVNLAFFPFLILASILQLKDLSGSERKKYLAGVSVAQEALSAHRVVTSFGLETFYSNLFLEKCGHTTPLIDWSNIFFSTVSTVAQSMQYFQMAASFSVGATLLRQKDIKTFTVFRAFTLISFSAQGVGRAASFLPDLKSANVGARQIMSLLERQSQMDVDSGETPEGPFSGKIEFKDVEFSYPDRKYVKVLEGFSHTVEAGTSVALVGQSGCGKSTILQLIERFYDADNFEKLEEGVFMDGRNVKDLSPNWIRQHIGVVLQNTDLFDLSIRDNIAFGDCSRELSMSDIIEAAKVANIHDFITNLPMGYDTKVGIRGSQLSGGQRQRIAIARALVRRPALLLLDEATSALDAENERDVQEALSQTIAKAKMTCVVVAHRLSTVEACDFVVVVDRGRKIECGPPGALLQARGAFYALHSASG
ncbi:Multidrug resistance protein 1A [Echinococcus granulosus]|uniref:ATP binding cassette subfamily B MDR:TAP n=1 Tax=Echinococcus granulosus TaxID=6210 RepID=A0A068WG57_ECHGR|nr:Multidrug resistance protein 1A [Echinococcus granulosus]CDS16585.1 ATP binding cassette subfamily B MDR:TAP [Echinococcus granulosus]